MIATVMILIFILSGIVWHVLKNNGKLTIKMKPRQILQTASVRAKM